MRRHRHQRHADDRDDAAIDQRREKFGDARKNRRNDQPKDGGVHDRAKHPANTAAGMQNADHGGNTGKRYALHQRQTATEKRQAQSLQQRGHTTHEQASGHQQTSI